MSDGLLEFIADWANASENETLDKEYFFPSSHLRRIVQQNRIVAIGRKGTGKTALANHIANLSNKEVLASGVKLASLDMPSEGGSVFSNFEALSKGWSKVILEAVAEIVLDSLSLTPEAAKAHREALGLLAPRAQSGFVDRVRQIKLNASIFGVELGLGASPQQVAVSLDQHNERLRTFIEENWWTTTRKLIVVFDGLDEGYVQAWQTGQETAYFRTITALIAAAISEKNYFTKLPVRRQVLPVVFIRSDIFDRLHHQQKTAWQMDQGINLSWDDAELEQFCKFRVWQAARQFESAIAEKDALKLVFKTQSGVVETLVGGESRERMTQYVVEYSLGRPRDVVMFMQAAARRALQSPAVRGGRRISKEMLSDARRIYGVFLKKEIDDELHGEYPIVNIMLNRLASYGHARFTVEDFRSVIDSIRTDQILAGDAFNLAERLFDVGFFGHHMADGTRRFAMKDDDIKFEPHLPLIVHPCYAMALNLRVASQ